MVYINLIVLMLILLVFQNFNLFPHLTVLDNITMAPKLLKKKDKREAEKKACELLKKVGLEDKKN